MGCQTDIAEKIIDKGGDYLLALKANQSTLFEAVKRAFKAQRQQPMDGIIIEKIRVELRPESTIHKMPAR
ncbi:hypothetical protein PSECIP111854_01259 [Pseudoalteromonas sp. CIP111854]|uniref:Transposase n=1 Tax=Pseudoalteromonas holothuriae TaxID=2963714 RepID=A0A9W4VNP2_9GAMM|nr:hypothetical protein PSECIP111854_01259 [Pseudoalteromonas sp. CIP111854]